MGLAEGWLRSPAPGLCWGKGGRSGASGVLPGAAQGANISGDSSLPQLSCSHDLLLNPWQGSLFAYLFMILLQSLLIFGVFVSTPALGVMGL